MSGLAGPLREALVSYRAGRWGVEELAAWARSTLEAHFADPRAKYAFRDDALVEALGLLSAADAAPEPDEEVLAAQALAKGEVPFTASRLVLVDPAWVAEAPCAGAAALVSEMGARIDRGESWERVLASTAGALEEACEALAGDDYVELLCLEAAAVAADLRLAVNGTVEVLGRGRPRVDAGLVAERLGVVGQVLRGERPLRAWVRACGADDVRAVVSC